MLNISFKLYFYQLFEDKGFSFIFFFGAFSLSDIYNQNISDCGD